MLVAACTCQSWGRVSKDADNPQRLRAMMEEHLKAHIDRPDLHKIYLANRGSGYELQASMVAIET